MFDLFKIIAIVMVVVGLCAAVPVFAVLVGIIAAVAVLYYSVIEYKKETGNDK